MRKFSYITLLTLLIALLTACGSNDATTGTNEPEEDPKQSEQKEVSNEEEKKEETKEATSNTPEIKQDENGNYILDTVGQVLEDESMGTIELMKIKELNEKVEIAPIEVTVENIKLFKITNMPEDMKTEFSMYTDSVGDEVNYIQIAYKSENIEEKNIDWYGIEKVVLSNGQQLDAVMNDFIITDEDMDSIFYGKVKKEGVVGLVYKGNPKDIKSAKLIFHSSLDADTYDNITDSQQVEYTF